MAYRHNNRPAHIEVVARKAREQGLPRVDSLVGSAEALSVHSRAFDEMELVLAPLAHSETPPSLPARLGQSVMRAIGRQ
jgi:hypothetical protein